MVPDLEDVGLEICPAIAILVSASALASPMDRTETPPEVIFRTMEFWLMSSEKVEVGLRTEMVGPGSRLIVSQGGASK